MFALHFMFTVQGGSKLSGVGSHASHSSSQGVSIMAFCGNGWHLSVVGERRAPRGASAVMASAVLLVTFRAQGGMLPIAPCLGVISVGTKAKVAKTACNEAAINTRPVKRVTFSGKAHNLHRAPAIVTTLAFFPTTTKRVSAKQARAKHGRRRRSSWHTSRRIRRGERRRASGGARGVVKSRTGSVLVMSDGACLQPSTIVEHVVVQQAVIRVAS